MNDDERTPPPRVQTQAYGVPMHIEPQTNLRADLRTVLIVVGGLLTGGFFAGAGYYQLTERVSRLDERMGTLVTKFDLLNLQNEAVRATRERLRNAVIKCPRQVTKGEAVALCEVVLPPGE